MKRVTRVVRPEDLGPLLVRPPRATLAFVSDGRIEAVPAAFRWAEGRYFVGWPLGSEPPVARVKLLIDDGPWYFDLRGVWVRGSLVGCDAPTDGSPLLGWYELHPEKVAAWHYGRMRQV